MKRCWPCIALLSDHFQRLTETTRVCLQDILWFVGVPSGGHAAVAEAGAGPGDGVPFFCTC